MKKEIAEYIWERFWPRWERFVLRSGYDPKKYWESRGRFFHLERVQRESGWQHGLLLDTLSKLDWQSLLEVGCGFGRNLKLVRSKFPSKTLTGVDLSESMVNQARAYLRDSFVSLHVGSVLNSFALEPADVVLSHGLLMHVPEDEVQAALQAIGRLSNQFIISVDEVIPGIDEPKVTTPINAFTFHHPYRKLFASQGWSVLNEDRRGPLAFFLLRRP